MRYFNVMFGLRGCYMPDNSCAVAVATRRELKGLLADEVAFYALEDERRPSKRDIASAAAALWRRSPRDRDSYLSTVLPLGEHVGIQVNPIDRHEYLESQEQ